MSILIERIYKFDRFFNMVDKMVNVVIVIVFIMLFGMLNTQVLTRYIIRTPIIWIEELAGFFLAWLTLWGSSSCIRTNSHIRVSFIEKYIRSLRLRHCFSIFVHLIMLVYLYFLTVYGYQFALMGRGELTPSNTFDFFIPRLSIATGGALMIIQSIGIILREFAQMLSSKPLKETGIL